MWQTATVLDSVALAFADGNFWFQKDVSLNTYFLCDLEQVYLLQSHHENEMR